MQQYNNMVCRVCGKPNPKKHQDFCKNLGCSGLLIRSLIQNKKFSNGMTVRDLKALIKDWPEINSFTDEETEVWITTGIGLSSQVANVAILNKRSNEGDESADILFESGEFSS